MDLVPVAIAAELAAPGRTDSPSWTDEAAWTGDGTVTLGPLEVITATDGGRTMWSVANRGDAPVAVRSVALVHRLTGTDGPVRLFRNGYQSWSPTATAVLGVDHDPSARGGLALLRAAHHADQRPARPGELRSEWVALLADDRTEGAPLLVGFVGGAGHDGTVRLAPAVEAAGPGDGDPVVRSEAHLGGCHLAPGAERPLHPVVVDGGSTSADELLGRWAETVAADGRARRDAPYQVGWCSWYQYFHDITEADLRANLALADQWPFDVFQLDDGFQAAIGDWLETNERFPSDLAGLAGAIRAAGRTPGLWLAPFLVAPDSDTAVRHPDWLARHVVDGEDRGPLRTWWNPSWGGGRGGAMYGLDTTHPEVAAHLEAVAAAVVEAGFPYLKLDFTFSPSVDGGYTDPARTPAERVRAGFDALRRGAGDDAFLLGCGVPLANVVGVVDAVRIGPDVAPVWALPPDQEVVPGYLGTQPATAHALTNTLTRSWMHRRLWLNDPDCLMLRTAGTDLEPEAARTWARAVAASGGMALVSDDLALLDDRSRALLDEVVAVGRASDDDARRGRPASCPDLLAPGPPGHLISAAGPILDADPATGATRSWTPGPTTAGGGSGSGR